MVSTVNALISFGFPAFLLVFLRIGYIRSELVKFGDARALMKARIALGCAIAFLGSALVVASPAVNAQEVAGQPVIDLSVLDALPDDVKALVIPALQSGDITVIADAIGAAVAAHPELAVQIASLSAQAYPPAAPAIAGAATAAVMASGQSPTGIVVAIAQAVVQAVPASAPQIAVAVFQSLPAALQDNANRSLIIATVSSAVPAANTATTLVAVSGALASLSTDSSSTLTAPIVTQDPVSGT
jgi:hypothetical protein